MRQLLGKADLGLRGDCIPRHHLIVYRIIGVLPVGDFFDGRDSSTTSSAASLGRRIVPALSNSMPRLVAEETHDSSGPIEATVGSGPVEASLLASLRLHSEPILRSAFLSQNSVYLTQLGRLLFIDFTHVLGLFFLRRPFNTGDVETFFFTFIVNDTLDLPGCLD